MKNKILTLVATSIIMLTMSFTVYANEPKPVSVEIGADFEIKSSIHIWVPSCKIDAFVHINLPCAGAFYDATADTNMNVYVTIDDETYVATLEPGSREIKTPNGIITVMITM